MKSEVEKTKPHWFFMLGPGILVAATGVGAGDLATAAFTGNKLGVAILWAVAVGALLKFVLNEGLARWQLATDSTLLEGAVRNLGKPAIAFFGVYLILWTYFVCAALMSAVGVTVHAIIPIFDASSDKALYGGLASIIAVGLVIRGGYHLFEKVMGVCVAIMFTVVITTALALVESWPDVFKGLTVPQIPDFRGQGLDWTIALMGGVGGTLTVLCYGYWIREENRSGLNFLPISRIDLVVGYVMTALFGFSMIIIGSQVEVEGKGSELVVNIADRLVDAFPTLGTAIKWLFLVGAFGAVFSSLLGVWQSVPYLFADFCQLLQKRAGRSNKKSEDLTQTRPYQIYLLAMAIIPMSSLFVSFEQLQKLYAICGAMFMPMLAGVLLYLNGTSRWLGQAKNGWLANTILTLCLLAFAYAGATKIYDIFS